MPSLPVTFANLPTGMQPLALFDLNFAYLLALIEAGSVGFQPTIETSDTIAVDSGTQALVLNQPAPVLATTINLPAVADQDGLGLIISDWAGNGGDISLIPDGTETIMKLSSWTISSGGLGLGGILRIFPATALNGWYIG